MKVSLFPPLLFRAAGLLGVAVTVIGVAFSGCDSPSEQSLSQTTSRTFSDQTQNATSTAPLEQARERQATDSSRVDLPRIVAFGDSLTAGLGVAPDQAYPARLQKRLQEVGHQYRVVNAGVSGETTAGGLRRLNWILKSQPTIVILELGANDGLRGHNLNETYENLRQIIQGLQVAGVTVLLVGMKIPPNYGMEYTAKFSGMYPQLAKEHGIPLMPFFLEGVATQPALNQADGLHPTGEGYRIIVENLLPLLEPLLKKQAKAPSSILFDNLRVKTTPSLPKLIHDPAP